MKIDSIDFPYVLVFPGGACGSFVETIVYYYLYKTGKFLLPVKLELNESTGECRINHSVIPHTHYTDFDNIYKSKIIAINYDEDDRFYIAKMMFHKNFKTWIPKNLDATMDYWSEWEELKKISGDEIKLEELFLVDLSTKVPTVSNWQEGLSSLSIDLLINFKQIFNDDLNQIIIDHLQTSRLPEVDEFITQYRQINQKYFN